MIVWEFFIVFFGNNLEDYRGDITNKDLLKEGLKMHSPDRRNTSLERNSVYNEDDILVEKPIRKFNENLLTNSQKKKSEKIK